MGNSIVAQRIKREFDAMAPQMQTASRFILEHPSEVALLSMREQARRAGVLPATMTRLAQRLGFSGYDELKAVYADAVRDSAAWFSGRAVGLLNRQQEVGDAGLVTDLAQTLADYVRALAHPEMLRALLEGADVLARARHILAVGARSAFPVVYEFSYVQSYFWDRAVLLDAPGGIGTDRLHSADHRDAMFVVSFEPYARSTVETVGMAASKGISIVAITDSDLSPVARPAKVAILVPKRSLSFYDTMVPAFAASEMLVALLASRAGKDVPEAVRQRESQYQESGLVWAETDFAGNGAGSPRRRNGAATRSRKGQSPAARSQGGSRRAG
jgi:DNA-binding MurR/RpiR family transcriptional regulator